MPIVKSQLVPMRTTTKPLHRTASGIVIGSAYVPRLRADQAGWIDTPLRVRKRPWDPEDRIVLWAVVVVAVVVFAFKLWR